MRLKRADRAVLLRGRLPRDSRGDAAALEAPANREAVVLLAEESSRAALRRAPVAVLLRAERTPRQEVRRGAALPLPKART